MRLTRRALPRCTKQLAPRLSQSHGCSSMPARRSTAEPLKGQHHLLIVKIKRSSRGLIHSSRCERCCGGPLTKPLHAGVGQQLLSMTWKKLSSAASWTRRAWPVATRKVQCNRSSAAKKSAATIPALAVVARGTRSAAGRRGRFRSLLLAIRCLPLRFSFATAVSGLSMFSFA